MSAVVQTAAPAASPSALHNPTAGLTAGGPRPALTGIDPPHKSGRSRCDCVEKLPLESLARNWRVLVGVGWVWGGGGGGGGVVALCVVLVACCGGWGGVGVGVWPLAGVAEGCVVVGVSSWVCGGGG
ncbi:hypothetical protein GCM10022251_36820 [Phytohabitans flavus]